MNPQDQTRQNSATLLPCPFCGSSASIRKDFGTYCVVCDNTDCYCALGEGYDRDAEPCHSFDSEREASSKWNTRINAAMPTVEQWDCPHCKNVNYDTRGSFVVCAECGQTQDDVPTGDKKTVIQALIETVELLMVTCADPKSWHEAKALLARLNLSPAPLVSRNLCVVCGEQGSAGRAGKTNVESPKPPTNP